MTRPGAPLLLAGASTAFLGAFALSLMAGARMVPLGALLPALLAPDLARMEDLVVHTVRLPRALEGSPWAPGSASRTRFFRP